MFKAYILKGEPRNMAHHQGNLQALSKLPQHGRHVAVGNRAVEIGLPNAFRAQMVPSCVLSSIYRLAAFGLAEFLLIFLFYTFIYFVAIHWKFELGHLILQRCTAKFP